jgi:hypothetical protein
VAGALAVELASAEIDVGGAVAVHPRLRDKASGASIAGVKSDGLEDGEHFDGSLRNANSLYNESSDFAKIVQKFPAVKQKPKFTDIREPILNWAGETLTSHTRRSDTSSKHANWQPGDVLANS